jgi:Transposase
MSEGSWVGLDVHARSMVAGVIDQGSGEVRSLRLPPGGEATVAWLQTLPAPVRVVYEAGPTGFGLARAFAGAGINCVVAAPSRIRAAADRVKTDRRDPERLARLLRLGEITPVRIPAPEEEAARDLVRAREDARGDLMRARHRPSKLLLRHGAVYDATAWTRAHDAWLRRQRFQNGPLAIVFDECYGRMPIFQVSRCGSSANTSCTNTTAPTIPANWTAAAPTTQPGDAPAIAERTPFRPGSSAISPTATVTNTTTAIPPRISLCLTSP